MENKHAELFTPFQAGSMQVKNRFVLCPMEGTNIVEGLVGYKFNKHAREFFIERAKADVGLMICGMIPIKTYMGEKWLYKQEKIFTGPIKSLMDEVHSHGAKFFMQLGAGMGRVMVAVPMLEDLYFDEKKKNFMKHLKMDVDRIFAGPTAGMPNVWNPDIKTIEMSKKDIEDIIEAFGKTALLAKNAGVDGIDVHAVHEGYLLDQFTMNLTNKRDDEYGGSLENRARFACEIVKSIKRHCGEDYPVSVRYSVTSKIKEFNKGAVPGEKFKEAGRDYEESIQLAKLLEQAGADMLTADNGSYDAWYWAHPPVYMPHECNLEDCAFIKKHVSIPVVCAGRMEDPDAATKAIKTGQIDGIGIARQFLCDGEYAKKVKENRLEEIRPCIACHNGCFAVYRYKGVSGNLPDHGLGKCALNPYTMDEDNHRITKAKKAKKIAIVGGGIAGMEAARVSVLRGHTVDLYEKSDELGGVFIAAGAPDFKKKDKMLLKWYERQMQNPAITLHMNKRIDSLDELDADEIIVATGATPRKLNIPGIENANVIEAIEYLRKTKPAGDSVVIIGGGLTGCEIAYDLAKAGKKPVIVEMQDDLMKVKNLSAANSNMLRDLLDYYKVPVHLEGKVANIEKDKVTIQTQEGSFDLKVDTVIVSCGYESITPLASKKVHCIGDAVIPGNLENAIWPAYRLAMKL